MIIENHIEVRHGDSITRARRLGFEHPNGEWELVEYFLPVNGRKTEWAHKSKIRPAPFKNLLGANFNTSCRSFYLVDFIRKYKFTFHQSSPIDMFGYVYLTDKEEKDFWEKFRERK